MTRSLFSILFLSLFLTCYGQGLQFNGNDKHIGERTSYCVFEKKSPSFKNKFSIRFDISILKQHSFGYIFRLKDEYAGQTYSFVYKYENDEVGSFMFNTEGKDNLLSIYLPAEVLGSHNWLKASFDFLLNENAVVISLDGQKYRVDNMEFSRRLHPRIYFGRNEYVIDVPDFAIRELVVGGDHRRYVFPLRESEGEEVHDDAGKVTGRVSSPVWLINNSFYWKLRYSYGSDIASGVNYDEQADNFIFFNRDSLVVLNMRTGLPAVKRYANELPVDIHLGTSFMDGGTGNLYVYEVNNLPEDAITIAYIDYMDGGEWISAGRQYLAMQLHHHDGYFDAKRGRYIVFGGFGNQRYNGEFLSLDIAADRWDTLPFRGDTVTPRYFSGMAALPEQDLLYIFGGMGNELGDQTIGRNYFYDLYRVDLGDMRITRLWSIPWTGENVVSSRNMVIPDDNSFYTLCYPEHKPRSYLQLYRFSIEDGSYEILGDVIPMMSEKINTNANLYYNSRRGEFYCTTQEFRENDRASLTRLYSLAAPPIGRAELDVGTDAAKRSAPPLWLWLAAAVLLPVFLLYVLYKNRKRKKIRVLDAAPLVADSVSAPQDIPNAIYVFGDFTVYDRKGRDITYMFSSRLKQAFLLALQYGSEDGIPAREFSDALWPDKSADSAKNLRNVTVNHLRKILAELDGIELLFESGKLRLVKTDACYCDYVRLMQALDSSDGSVRISAILDILPRGRFLKSAASDILKDFVDKTNSRIISLLPIEMENAYSQRNYPLAIRLAELLFISDPLNAQALWFQINSLYRIRQADNAKIKYALFAARYRKENGRDYPDSFATLLKEKI